MSVRLWVNHVTPHIDEPLPFEFADRTVKRIDWELVWHLRIGSVYLKQRLSPVWELVLNESIFLYRYLANEK